MLYSLHEQISLHNKKFIIGGPASYLDVQEVHNINNIEVLKGYFEDNLHNLFGIPNQPLSSTWSVPNELLKDKLSNTKLGMSLALSYNCYWNRCKFCLGYKKNVKPKVIHRQNFTENLAKVPKGSFVHTVSSSLTVSDLDLLDKSSSLALENNLTLLFR